MTTNEIRTKFLDFFKSKGSSIIASDSLVPKDDPTVLFTTAGMQQFKGQFLGHLDGFTRAATCQKCLRTDDLDVVGKTDFHHTFFEMLGNFSFGDYFKKDAIHWAWEFLTRELKLPQDKLWVSVYQEDKEAYDIWAKDIKIPQARIIKLGDKSNFWPSNARQNGPNGPCGPCSEIFFDYGVNPNCAKGQACDPDCSCGRFSEVWNLVFTQFNRKDGGSLEPLPAKNIDTGMGLERLAAVVQGVKSNYDTDNFLDIIESIIEIQGRYILNLTQTEIRIIADHSRSIVMAIADGVIPSNEGRGYVVRKLIVDSTDIMIRASATGIIEPMLYKTVDAVIEVMKGPYPELSGKANEIKELVMRIEESFIKTRKERIPEFQKDIKHIVQLGLPNDQFIDQMGSLWFKYRDTYGVPLPTISATTSGTIAISSDQIKAIELIESELMNKQKERSRAGSKMAGDVFANQDFALNVHKTEFLGYMEGKADAKVLRILVDGKGERPQASKDQWVKIILDRTPFYAESGGQVGDTGELEASGVKVKIGDTRKVNDIYFHDGRVIEGTIKTGDLVQAKIDMKRRQAVMRNHTATHLLQAALREILGKHIKQQGSLVEESRFRFDFTHPKGVSPQEIKAIENRVDEFIRRNDPVKTEILALEEAKKKGALAFFAEKYGQTVRVVSIGDYSREFCGGTHVSSTGQIEAIKIVSEGSIAQGIRRVEGLTGKTAVVDFFKRQVQESAALEEAQRIKQEERAKRIINFEKLKSSLDLMINAGVNINGARLVVVSVGNIDIEHLRKLSDLLKQKVKTGIFILGAKGFQEASVIVSVTDDLVARGIEANELVDKITPLLEGSGGGRPHLAQAGSKDPKKLDGALAKAKQIVSMEMKQKV